MTMGRALAATQVNLFSGLGFAWSKLKLIFKWGWGFTTWAHLFVGLGVGIVSHNQFWWNQDMHAASQNLQAHSPFFLHLEKKPSERRKKPRRKLLPLMRNGNITVVFFLTVSKENIPLLEVTSVVTKPWQKQFSNDPCVHWQLLWRIICRYMSWPCFWHVEIYACEDAA